MTLRNLLQLAAVTLVLAACSNPDELALAEAKGVTRGQCSMMRWYLDTHALKELDEHATRINYLNMCGDYQ